MKYRISLTLNGFVFESNLPLGKTQPGSVRHSSRTLGGKEPKITLWLRNRSRISLLAVQMLKLKIFTIVLGNKVNSEFTSVVKN